MEDIFAFIQEKIDTAIAVAQSLAPPPKPTPTATVAAEKHIAGPAQALPSATRSPAETGPVHIDSLAAGAHNGHIQAHLTLDSPAVPGARALSPYVRYKDSALGNQIRSSPVLLSTSGHLRGDQTSNASTRLQLYTIPLSRKLLNAKVSFDIDKFTMVRCPN